MDLSSFAPPHLSFAKCIVELVLNSLKANATCIAIRIHNRRRTFHVIDNGLGIKRRTLSTIGEEQLNDLVNFNSTEKHLLSRIRRLADAMSISSRTCNSNTTYTKKFRRNETPKMTVSERRPSCGTTASIYGFYDISHKKWDLKTMYYAIGSIALNCPNVTFSIRDDETQKITMAFPKSRRPMTVLQALYPADIFEESVWFVSHESSYYSRVKFVAFVGISKRLAARQYVFLNNRPINAPQTLRCITSIITPCIGQINPESIFILLFVTSNRYSLSLEDGLILPNLRSLIEIVQKCVIEKRTGIHVVSNSSSVKFMRVDRMTDESYRGSGTCREQSSAFGIPESMINQQSYLLHVNASAPKLRTVQDYTNRRHLIRAVQIVKKRIRKTEILGKKRETPINVSKSDFTTNASIKDSTIGEKRQSDISSLDLDYVDELCGFITPKRKRMKTITENFTLSLSQLSEWSYHSTDFHGKSELQKETQKNTNIKTNAHLPVRKRFDFLPPILNAMVPNTSKKLITLKLLSGSDASIISMKRRYGLGVSETLNHQALDVRPCKTLKKFCEFRFDKNHLNSLQVLGQICNQVIAALVSGKGMKVLLLLDQHAIHERIRYEELLNKYTSFGRKEILSVKLKESIVIEMPDTYDLVMSNKDLLRKYGIKLSWLKPKTIIIHGIPECFKKNKYHHDEARLKMTIKNLIDEVSQSFEKPCPFSVLNLPATLQNSIATEACHGAIKFGDQLSLEQCKSLVELLKRTKIPTQCAHGRPSIIPMLDLSDWDKSRKKITQVYIESTYYLHQYACELYRHNRNTGLKTLRFSPDLF